MKPTALIALLGLGLGITAIFLASRPPAAADATRTPADTPPALTPGPHWTDEEVFRRAFWRHPSARDQILHAERREPAADAPGAVQTWQWFLAVHPSADLLNSLRDPETFGLTPTAITAARPWPTDPAPPDWFPASAPASLREFEVMQTSAGHLTLLYRERDNVLFATDTGGGFALAARPFNVATNSSTP